MGFIFGIVNFNNIEVNENEIKSLSESVKWENFSEHFEIESNIALGYCSHPDRIAKVGIYKHENLLVLADIRIYNTDELKAHFSFESYEEAFCKAYIKWGANCSNYINGDFAVVVIDKKKNEVHIFRDHIGVRPISYFFENNRLVFASHQFAIAKSGLATMTISDEIIISRLLRKKPRYPKTIFNNIFRLTPGYYAIFTSDSVKTNKYWKPECIKQNKNLSYEESIIKLRELLINATNNRIEDGNIGVHVSGGIDSTGVASILADCIEDKTRITGYSWTPENLNSIDPTVRGGNEKRLIEAFSKDKLVKVKYLNYEKNEFIMNSLIPEFEEMHIEHSTMKVAEKDKVISIFSGWGGDEFVSLSIRGVYNHLFFSFNWLKLLKVMLKRSLITNLTNFRTDIFPALVPFGLLPVYRGWKKDNLKYLNKKLIEKYKKNIFNENKRNIFGYGNRTKFMLNLLELHHIPNRMDSWSLFSEKYGFEYKYPLLDKEVLEFWFSIPVEYTFRDMKSRFLYREALKGILIEEIRLRKDKTENLRIQNTNKNILEGIDYIVDKLDSITNIEVEEKFDLNEILNLKREINSLTTKERKDGIRIIALLIKINEIYLRYIKK